MTVTPQTYMVTAEVGSIVATADLLSGYYNAELIAVGDFNLNWLNETSDHLTDILGSLNDSQLLTEPTRPNLKDDSKSSLLDLILTNRPDKITACGVFDLGVSDHCRTACI